MQSFINRILRQPLLVLLAGIALLFASHGAQAGASCSGGGGTFDIPLPSTVAVPRDVPIGTAITPWKYSSDSSWSCYATAGYSYNASAFSSIGGALAGTLTTPSPGSGVGSYRVKATNVPGVGIAVAVDSKSNASASCSVIDWLDVFSPNSGTGGAGWDCGTDPGTTSGTQTLRVAVALVKIGAITPGVVAAQEVAQGKTFQGWYPEKTNYVPLAAPIAYYRTPAISVTEVSCEVADVDVLLGTHSATDFAGSNKVGVTDFTINVQNCPAGMKTVKYRLELAPGVTAFDATQGIVKLDATSTATGVGVQVTDRSDVPYNLSTMPWKTVTPTYAPATGGNYTIPLRAAYYKIAPTVTPGDANSALMFTMQYL